MGRIVKITSVAAVLIAVSSVGADPLPVEHPSGRSYEFSPAGGSDQRRQPRRGVRKERRAVERPADTDDDAAPQAPPASMPTDLSAPPRPPDDRETSLV